MAIPPKKFALLAAVAFALGVLAAMLFSVIEARHALIPIRANNDAPRSASLAMP